MAVFENIEMTVAAHQRGLALQIRQTDIERTITEARPAPYAVHSVYRILVGTSDTGVKFRLIYHPVAGEENTALVVVVGLW